jgi:NADH-quinone oxidoreductase subunit L
MSGFQNIALVLRDRPHEIAPFLVLLLPLAGFVVLSLLADALKRDKEERGACWLACATVLAAFGLSVWSLKSLLALPPGEGGYRFAQPYLMDWIAVGGFTVPLNLLLDPLSAVMILVVTGVGSLIHIYSLGYMAHDEGRVRYFSYLNLFTFFMLLLVLGGNLPLMFVGWEGVGLCSYLLIGFWFQKKSAADAGKKAFIVNRVGDAGLILGMIVAYYSLGTLDLTELAGAASSLAPEGPGEWGAVTAVCLLLFVGACGKSAQIPLHVWLPDAMEGPTPVSALIHAATMVTAGVYLVCRLGALYSISATAATVVAVVGATTAFVAATIALVQNDIKKVLAYSTVSQLGYMFLAAGVGAYGVAVFHLFTHAFFKALLFLGSGSVIHAMGGEQDLRKMGGLARKIPWTYATFVVGTAAIAGVPFLSGFLSKDAILEGVWAAHRPVLFAVGLVTALLTAFYMTRLLVLAFWGRFRGDHEAEHHVHESPWTMLAPLVLLAVGSIVVGYQWLIPLLSFVQPAFRLAAEGGAAHHAAWLPYLATVVAALGIAAAAYLFSADYAETRRRLAASLARPARVLEAKYYFDHAFDWLAERVAVRGSEQVLWRGLDAGVIDAAVNGTARVTSDLARRVRSWQTGLVRGYALVMLGGAVLLVGYLLWLR